MSFRSIEATREEFTPGSERFLNDSGQIEVLTGDSGIVGCNGIKPVSAEPASPAADFWRPGLLAARIAACFACLFMFACLILAAPTPSSAQVAIGVSVTFPPPALPVYVQPLCPGPGYIWIPGYWAWDPAIGYFWVPGTWVPAPYPGALWTPGYWGWNNGVYVWYEGYWGPVVGFYGGINYGFGYSGFGYNGGYWSRGVFHYNRAVNNVNVTNIRNVYYRPFTGRVTKTRASYNGGRGGITAHPSEAQLTAARKRHSPPTGVQREQERGARGYSGQRAAVNHGRPSVAATPKPGVFSGHGLVRASRAGAPYKSPPGRTVAPVTPSRTPHPAGVERRPAAVERGHAAPSAIPKGEQARPSKSHPAAMPPHAVPGRVSPYQGETRPHMAPRAVPERPAVIRPPSPPRAAPARPMTEHPPSPPHAGPPRQGAPHPPQGGGGKREERGQH